MCFQTVSSTIFRTDDVHRMLCITTIAVILVKTMTGKGVPAWTPTSKPPAGLRDLEQERLSTVVLILLP